MNLLHGDTWFERVGQFIGFIFVASGFAEVADVIDLLPPNVYVIAISTIGLFLWLFRRYRQREQKQEQ